MRRDQAACEKHLVRLAAARGRLSGRSARPLMKRAAMRITQAVLATVLGLAISSELVHAQWLNYPTPGVPRLPDGKPNLAAAVPRTAEGKPDLTGVWMHELTS